MRQHAPLVIMTLLVVPGCSSPQTPPADVAANPTPWRGSLAAFQAHLERVHVGWTTERLRAHAGEPDSRTGDTWVYSWIENAREGGYTCDFRFAVKDHTVAAVESSLGHETRTAGR